MYSNYKKHPTVKFLIACNPLGTITFLSKAYGGRATDKHIVQNSGFFNANFHKLGSQILADRGFNMHKQFADILGVELITPAYTKRRAQFSAKDVEESRKKSNIPIHVERII